MVTDEGHLHLLGSETFQATELYRVVTFLNQCLKQRGLIFGLSRDGEVYSLRIYSGRCEQASDPAKPTEGSQE